MKSKVLFGGIVVLIIIAAVIIGCVWLGGKINDKLSEINPTQPTAMPINPGNQPPAAPNDANQASGIFLALGNPSNAAANVANPNNFLLSNKFYVVAYNRDKALPNWVAWRLTASDFGDIERQNDYRPDESLPAGWTRVLPSDFSRSGFDRGHLCPSADRSASPEANSATFLLTNFAPQTPDLNQGPWEKLESYSRSMARRDTTLYIYAGQYGALGKLKNKVTIPSNFWKIVVVVPNNGDVSAVNADTRVIVVDMPNISGIKEKNWRDYRTNVQQIEKKTGYKFFTNLAPALQESLKTRIDTR